MKFRFWGPMRFAEALAGTLEINLLDSRGIGPLHWCIDKGEVEHFDRLLAAGADPNLATSHLLDAPLHYAMSSPNIHFARALLDARADVDRKNKAGQTPLLEAIRANNLAAGQFLLERGADTLISSRHKETPYGTALILARMELVKLLEDRPKATTRTATEWLYYAAAEKNWQIIPYLIQRGAKIHAPGCDGRTALELAKLDPEGWGADDAEYTEYLEQKRRTMEALETARPDQAPN